MMIKTILAFFTFYTMMITISPYVAAQGIQDNCRSRNILALPIGQPLKDEMADCESYWVTVYHITTHTITASHKCPVVLMTFTNGYDPNPIFTTYRGENKEELKRNIVGLRSRCRKESMNGTLKFSDIKTQLNQLDTTKAIMVILGKNAGHFVDVLQILSKLSEKYHVVKIGSPCDNGRGIERLFHGSEHYCLANNFEVDNDKYRKIAAHVVTTSKPPITITTLIPTASPAEISLPAEEDIKFKNTSYGAAIAAALVSLCVIVALAAFLAWFLRGQRNWKKIRLQLPDFKIPKIPKLHMPTKLKQNNESKPGKAKPDPKPAKLHYETPYPTELPELNENTWKRPKDINRPYDDPNPAQPHKKVQNQNLKFQKGSPQPSPERASPKPSISTRKGQKVPPNDANLPKKEGMNQKDQPYELTQFVMKQPFDETGAYDTIPRNKHEGNMYDDYQ